jgi:ABC-2 type transport system permease protein
MIVFNTFWRIIKKYKGTILLYTVMLIIFGGINLTSNSTNDLFTPTKPNIFIVNKDSNMGLTKNLINYLKKNTNVVSLEDDEEKINDALFYRDISYVIYIPKNYSKDVLDKKDVTIDIKSSKDYTSSLTEMMLDKYLNVQSNLVNITNNQDELVNMINNTLDVNSEVVVSSKLDNSYLNRVSRYFNFGSYSLLAVIIFIVTLVINSFKENTINKRIIVSSFNYKKHNSLLMLSSFVYSLIVWVLFSLLSVILLGKDMISIRGILYFVNTFMFVMPTLSFGILISTLVNNKDSIGGIVNVVSLGSAFLCGAFIPTEYLPKIVLSIAHVFPAYYFIDSNNLLSSMEIINFSNLTPVFINYFVLIIFMLIFIVVNNYVLKKKRYY